MGFEILEDIDQFRPITPIRVVIPFPRALNNTKEEELLLLEDNHGHEECCSPKSPAGHVVLKQPLMCPPAPKKPRQTRRKFRPRPSQGFFKVPDDLASVFMVLASASTTSTPVKKIRTS